MQKLQLLISQHEFRAELNEMALSLFHDETNPNL